MEKDPDKKTKFVVANDTEEPFEEREEEKMINLKERAANMVEKLKKSKNRIFEAKFFVEQKVLLLEKEWPALFENKNINNEEKYYIHIDLDAFYASVEMLLNPEYKSIPLGVGTNMMLAACNYKAREFNIKAGMPGYHAKRLCPHLKITKCTFSKYNYYSELVMSIFSAYDPEVEIYGIDEACLVFDKNKLKIAYRTYNTNKKFGKISDDPELEYINFSFKSTFILIEKIRNIVFKNTELTVSAGISVCRGLAKFCSNIKKPNGQFMLTENLDQFLFPFSINKINGIGKMTSELLFKTLKIKTIEELRENLHQCYLMMPQKSFINLLRLSFGLSSFDYKFGSKQVGKKEIKSIGNGWTLKSTVDYRIVCEHLWNISKSVYSRMIKQNKYATVITLTIKYVDFTHATRQKKNHGPIKTTEVIFDLAMELLEEDVTIYPISKNKKLSTKVRMLGISLSSLIDINNCIVMDKFLIKQNFNVNPRYCIICREEFIHENNHTYESHVNFCITKKENEKIKEKKDIIHLLKKFKKIR